MLVSCFDVRLLNKENAGTAFFSHGTVSMWVFCKVAGPARPVAVAQTQPTESFGEGLTVGC